MEKLLEEGSLDFGATVLHLLEDMFETHPFYQEESKLLLPESLYRSNPDPLIRVLRVDR